MLGPGDTLPDVEVWAAPREGSIRLTDALGAGHLLLCFYLWDWSPT